MSLLWVQSNFDRVVRGDLSFVKKKLLDEDSVIPFRITNNTTGETITDILT